TASSKLSGAINPNGSPNENPSNSTAQIHRRIFYSVVFPPAMESQQKRQRTTRLPGRNLKRKLSRETDAASSIVMQITEVEDEEADLVASIRRHVEVLNSGFSDREAVKEAAAAISSLAKIDENVEMMVENGVIPALVRYLESPWSLAINPNVPKSCEHKLEKDCAVSLGLIAAIQPGYQQLIVDAGAIVPTVKLLKRRGICLGCMEANAVIRRAADIITNIAHDNPRIKTNIRVEGGIPPLVELLNFPDVKVQRAAAGALRTVSFRNDENKNQIVELNALPTLVLMLQSEDPSMHGEAIGAIGNLVHSSPDIKKEVIRAGALQPVISLLSSTCLETQREAALLIGICLGCMEANAVIRRAADIITNIAHDNPRIKTNIRVEGGIPPLVELLNFPDVKVQRAAAGALRTVSFRNDENKNQIVELNALPTLVLMLQSEDPSMHGEAIGAIGNLVHSSPDIKKEVIRAGALQPVISLLSSTCLETQREAALLIGQFASPDSDCKVHIAQRGAITPLIKMLDSSDEQVMEMSAFALGRLAQDTHNQAGIGQRGGIISLLNLLDVNTGSVQHNAAFALYGLADNEENIADFIKAGGIQRLQDDNFTVQPTRDCVVRTLKRLENKVHGPVLNQLLYLMRTTENPIQMRIALALAHLCDPKDGKLIFIDNNGVEFLLELLYLSGMKQQKYSSKALFELARKATSFAPEDSAPSSPTQRVFLGAEFVNNPTLSDVTFLAGGIQRLQDDNFTVQPTRDCVVRTLKRLENKVHGPVLNQLLYLMRTTENPIQMRIALALAHLCDPKDGKLIFIDNNGVEFLLELLYLSGMKQQKYSSKALFELARKATSFAPEDSAPSSPTQRVFLGAEFVNNPTLSDVTFLVDGKQFYAHKICLVASSDIFRAMFDGLYKERNAQNVEIPNITWEVFELMTRFIYTGRIDITKHLAQDLLVAADQYLIEGLKRLCEYTIAQDICVDNIPLMYDLADTFNASALRRACTLYVLEHYTKLSSETWFPMFIKKIIPEIRTYITDILTRPFQASSTVV
ncbi:hypothetical protein DY000_02019124, partial [Brassica cretica]